MYTLVLLGYLTTETPSAAGSQKENRDLHIPDCVVSRRRVKYRTLQEYRSSDITRTYAFRFFIPHGHEMTYIDLFPVSGCITAICTWLLWSGVWDKPRLSARALSLILAVSMFISLYALIRLEPITNQGLEFHLAASVAIIVLIVQYVYVLGLLRQGIHGLGLFLLPATAIPLLLIPLLPDAPILEIQTHSMMEASHLIFSLLAYAVLTLAMLHAIMHLLLDRALKRKQIGPIVQALPSLFEVENHMYAQVRSATWLLALGILTGLVWQWVSLGHLVLLSHKVILSVFSWAVLALLLTMRKRAGWQGKRASWMVISAYMLLLLAYFGTRMVQSWLHIQPI